MKQAKTKRVLSLVLALFLVMSMIPITTVFAAPENDLSVDLSFEGGDSEAINYDAPKGNARRATKFILEGDAAIGEVQVKITSCTGQRDLTVAIYGSTSDGSKPDDRLVLGEPITVKNEDLKTAIADNGGIVAVDFEGLTLFAGEYWVVLDTDPQSIEESSTIFWARITDTGAENNGKHYTAACGARPEEGKAGGWSSYTPHHYWLKVEATAAELTPQLEGYYTTEGGSTPVNFDVAVHSASTEEEALTALPASGYAKLNSGLYYPVQFDWTITGSYDGSDLARNSYTAKVTSENCPIGLDDITGWVTIEANAFVGYYDAAENGKKVSFDVDASHGTLEAPALGTLPDTAFEVYTNGTANEIQIAWAFDQEYDGADGAINTATGTVTSKDGLTAPYADTIQGSVTLSNLEGYYADEDCTIPLGLEVSVDWTGDAGADETASLAALPTTAYAKYSDGQKFLVSIAWTLDGAFDSKQFAANSYFGDVTSEVEGWKDYTDHLAGEVTLRGAMYTDAQDYTFPMESHTSNENVDYSNGTGRRAQMFVLEQKSYIGKVELMFAAYTGNKNVVVNLRPAKEDGNPDDSQLLATATISSSVLSENVGKPVEVDFGGVEVEAGKYYIELTTDPVGTPGDQVTWATTNTLSLPEGLCRAWTGVQNGGWSSSDQFGNHYLRVEYTRDYIPKEMVVDYSVNMGSNGYEDINYYQAGGGRGTVVRWLEDAKLESLDFFVNKTGTDDIELRIVETEVVSDKLTNMKTVASVMVPNAEVKSDYEATNVKFETPVELTGGKTYAFLLIPQGDTAKTYSIPLNNDTTMLKSYCGAEGQAWATGGGLHPFKLYIETDDAVEQPAEAIKTETTDPDDPNENLISAEDPVPDDQVDEDLNGDKPYFKTDGTLDYTFTPSAWEQIDYNTGARRGQIIEVTEPITVTSVDILIRLTGSMYDTERGPLNITLYDANEWQEGQGINPVKYWFTYTIPGSADTEGYEETGYKNGQVTTVELEEPVYLPVGTYALVFRPQPSSYGQFEIPNDTGAVGSYKMWSGGQSGNFDTAQGKHWVRLNATTKIEKNQPSYARKLSVDLNEALYYLGIEETLTPAISILDQYGQPMDLDSANFHAVSSNEDAAVVDPDTGIITGVDAGKATITYTAGTNLRYTVNVQTYVSTPNKVSGATVVAVKKGDTVPTAYTLIDDWKFDLGGSTLTYEIANTSIATVEEDGSVTGLSKGETVMTVKSGDLEKSVNISVYTADEVIEPTDGMVITSDVKFKPGTYILPQGITIAASDITVDGNGAVLVGQESPVMDEYGEGYINGGVGVTLNGFDNVTIKNLSAKNYNIGLFARDAKNLEISNNDFSDNFTNPDHGWGNGNRYGGILLQNVSNSVVKNNNANHVWNALMLVFSDKNKVYNNDFGICSNVCLYMWGSSFNEIEDNIFNWGIRCDPGETHARDSTSSLFEEKTYYNYIARNDFSHGGDGIFIRPLDTSPPMGNYFEENDVSWANNNGIESWAPGNTYVGNICNYSSYGIWLGGSDFTNLVGNIAMYNGGVSGGMENAPESFGNAGIAVVNGVSSHFLALGNQSSDNNGPGLAIHNASQFPYHWVISGNTLTGNNNYGGRSHAAGVYASNALFIDILGNNITDNDQGDTEVVNSSAYVEETGENKAAVSYDPDVLPEIKVDIFKTLSDYYHADQYWNDIPQQLKDSDWGIADIRYITVEAGQEITFDASQSLRADSYQWQFETTTVNQFDTFEGETVTYTFNTPGTYRAGVTALNTTDEMGNLKGFVVTVVPSGREIGTESPVENWEAITGTGSDAYTFLSQTSYNLEGDFGIEATAFGQNYGLSYPKNKNLDWSALEVNENSVLAMGFKVFVGNGNNNATKATPVLTLYKDAENYIQFTPNMPYMAPINMPTSEPRYAYQYVEFKLGGDFTNTYYTGSMTGSMTISEVKYFTITAGPNASNARSSFAVDSLKLVGVNGIVDKSDLDTLYQANKDKVQGDYTDESWQVFTDALNTAKAVLDDANATQNEADAAWQGLKDAVEGLVTETPVVVDKSDLDTLYQANKDKVQGDYTDESWQVFTDALNTAKAVLNDPNATQDEVDAAWQGLKDAVEGLVTETPVVVDKSDLDTLYQANKNKVQGNCTDESWQVFTGALDAAKAVLDDPNATQDEVDKALKVLQDAIAGLTENPDESSGSEESEKPDSSEESSQSGESSESHDTPSTGSNSTVYLVAMMLFMAVSAGCLVVLYHKRTNMSQ